MRDFSSCKRVSKSGLFHKDTVDVSDAEISYYYIRDSAVLCIFPRFDLLLSLISLAFEDMISLIGLSLPRFLTAGASLGAVIRTSSSFSVSFPFKPGILLTSAWSLFSSKAVFWAAQVVRTDSRRTRTLVELLRVSLNF
jgi:hypothetical protein